MHIIKDRMGELLLLYNKVLFFLIVRRIVLSLRTKRGNLIPVSLRTKCGNLIQINITCDFSYGIATQARNDIQGVFLNFLFILN